MTTTAANAPGPNVAQIVAAKQNAQNKPPPGEPPPAFDWYKNAEAVSASNTVTLGDLFEGIRSDEFRSQVERIRGMLAEGNKPDADALKKQLPAFSMSGSTKGRRKNAMQEGRFTHSGYLQIDLDGKDNPDHNPAEMRAALMESPHIAGVFLTPSGLGVKGFFRVSPIPCDATTHKAAFGAAVAHFAEKRLQIDPACKDPVRLCFVSYDPEAWLRPAPVEPFYWQDAISNDEGEQQQSRRLVIHAGNQPGDMTVEDLAAMLKFIPRQPYDDWVKICGGAWNHFGDAATPILQAWMPDEEPGEYEYKAAHRLENIGIGTVIRYATLYGYSPRVRVRAASLKITNEHAARLAEGIASGRFLAAMEDEHRGLAQAYADLRFSSRCFSHDELSWRHFDGGIWKRDATGSTFDDLQTSLTPLLVESANAACREMDPEKDKARIAYLKKRAKCLLNLRTARAVLDNAQVLPEFRAIRSDFDQSPHLLAIENGVLDFDTVSFREHRPGDMLTVKAPVRFDPDATCPTFDRFLDDVTCGDTELAAFLLELVAIGMTGHTHFDFMAFFFGGGSNGKGTFTQTIEGMLGNGLFRTLDNALLVGWRESSSDDYKRASLEGVRLALVDELPDGRKLRTDELKKLIGGDTVQARNPYERARSFRPTHKIWMAGNHKPEITTMDHGTWRRILLVPWNARFSGDGPGRDERVAAHLAESSGILNRVFRAWGEVKRRGLRIPAAVREASQEYKADSDQVGMFAEERLQRCAGVDILFSEIRKAYVTWCQANGEKESAGSPKKLSDELLRLGFTTRKGTSNRTFAENVAILPE